LMWHAFKKHDVEAVVSSSKELQAKDISCSGWSEIECKKRYDSTLV